MPGERLIALQLMRALAAGLVLVGHVIAEADHYFGVSLGLGWMPWTRGVDLFFVLSGFLIAQSAARRGPLSFLWARLWRVVPLYWLFTTLMVGVLLLLPGGAKDTGLDWAQIAHSYAFLPYERADGRIAPVLSLGWTLNYEIAFYLLAAVCLWLSPERWARALLFALAGAAGASVFVSAEAWAPLRVWTSPLILEFAFGVALARVHARLPRFGGWAALGLALAGVGLLIGLHQVEFLPRFIAAGVPAAMILIAAVIGPAPPLGRLVALGTELGDASYALYLSHRFTLRAMTLLLVPIWPAGELAAWGFVLVVCGAAMVISMAIYRGIERPLLRRAPKGRVA